MMLNEPPHRAASAIADRAARARHAPVGLERLRRAVARIKDWRVFRAVRAARERGSTATDPLHISAAGWASILVEAWRNGRDDNLNVLAAGIAFYMFLALVPFLAAVAMVYGLFAGAATVAEDIGSALAIIPGGAEKFVADRMARVIVNSSVGPLAAVLALLLATYSAARGARAIIAGLNVMYGRPKRKHFADRWALALVIALSGACLMLLALFAVALHGYVETFLPDQKPAAFAVIQPLFWIVMSLSISAALAVLYRYGPAGGRIRDGSGCCRERW